MNKSTLLALAMLASSASGHASEPVTTQAPKSDDYVPSLITETPLQGRQLAITLVRKTIGSIQKDAGAKQRVREKYEEDPALLMRAAELVALEFRTIAEANDYWRKSNTEAGNPSSSAD